MQQNKKIFIIGDSRTGTLTLHRYMQALGYSSVHYYVNEAGTKKPDHKFREFNWNAVKAYIEESAHDAFSDYPTRLYYKELTEEYPNSYFILSTRKDVETWQKSMVSFFSKFDMKLDMDKLTDRYIKQNDRIRKWYGQSETPFLEVCIDDGSDINSKKIKDFLKIESKAMVGWENKSDLYDNKTYSRRGMLYDTDSSAFVDYAESVLGESKSLFSERGWFFLANDTNNFLHYQYGFKKWSEKEIDKASSVIDKRNKYFNKKRITYQKFIVPEKSIVYSEFMPRLFDGKPLSDERPAQILSKANADTVNYLGDYLQDLKSYGLLYFRGDTHTNWLGAYMVYLHIIETIKRLHPGLKKPIIPLGKLVPKLAAFKGDMFNDQTKEATWARQGPWKNLQIDSAFEHLVHYKIPDKDRTAIRAKNNSVYERNFTTRETFTFVNQDQTLPKAVIFRDSTADYVIDLLSEHFSKCVIVWHRGAVYEDVIEKEKPDIVIHMMAERFVTHYPKFEPLSRMSVK